MKEPFLNTFAFVTINKVFISKIVLIHNPMVIDFKIC